MLALFMKKVKGVLQHVHVRTLSEDYFHLLLLREKVALMCVESSLSQLLRSTIIIFRSDRPCWEVSSLYIDVQGHFGPSAGGRSVYSKDFYLLYRQ